MAYVSQLGLTTGRRVRPGYAEAAATRAPYYAEGLRAKRAADLEQKALDLSARSLANQESASAQQYALDQESVKAARDQANTASLISGAGLGITGLNLAFPEALPAIGSGLVAGAKAIGSGVSSLLAGGAPAPLVGAPTIATPAGQALASGVPVTAEAGGIGGAGVGAGTIAANLGVMGAIVGVPAMLQEKFGHQETTWDKALTFSKLKAQYETAKQAFDELAKRGYKVPNAPDFASIADQYGNVVDDYKGSYPVYDWGALPQDFKSYLDEGTAAYDSLGMVGQRTAGSLQKLNEAAWGNFGGSPKESRYFNPMTAADRYKGGEGSLAPDFWKEQTPASQARTTANGTAPKTGQTTMDKVRSNLNNLNFSF